MRTANIEQIFNSVSRINLEQINPLELINIMTIIEQSRLCKTDTPMEVKVAAMVLMMKLPALINEITDLAQAERNKTLN